MANRLDGRSSVLLWGALGLGLLGACDVIAPDERPESGQAQALSAHPYANAVAPGTSAVVLNPNGAVGAPDGQVATLVSVLNTVLLLDMGEPEMGDLRVYYRGLSLALVAQVDFLDAHGALIGTGLLHLVELGLGTHVAVVLNPKPGKPYRYVRLRGSVLGLYGVDAVEAEGYAFCGDGRVGGAEVCDDGNQQSGDGCDSVCQVEPGYACEGSAPSVCEDIDECANGTDTCAPEEVCVNTPGGFECEAPACLPPRLVCDGVCVDPSSNDSHCGACGNACGPGRNCAVGTCVGTGTLQFTATWGREGDADLAVDTPTGKRIFFANRGPDEGTDFGELDVDAMGGMGPENVFWASGRTPPSGTYDVCLYSVSFSPAPSPETPVPYVLRVRRLGQADLVITGQVTVSPRSFECAPGEDGHIASVSYP
ncbi:EGF domain-containing protein [Myxococcus sp. K38C18041901]|uniref:DUF4215 domain-containing protein n=1 Tax=Myxococcus guangdongensis TaxID=2906760 RepID=UPI0020A7707F|nr:DUF4215 domain-containing protein [Myxococcus guangdongensis]MCP3063284.1 EGF domain-containing protein [Myxococcus guangdongensis]